MKYKLIAADFDNTIADKSCVISDYTKKVVAEYVARGGIFVISTGRIYKASKRIAEELKLDHELIAFQGAGIYDIKTDKLLQSLNIENTVAVEILKTVESFGRNVIQAYVDNDYYIEKENPISTAYGYFIKENAIPVNKKLSVYFTENGASPIKIVIFLSEKIIDDLASVLQEKFGGCVNVVKSQKTFLEVVNIKASKGLATEMLADKYNIKREEVMCFGDAMNDISMLDFAGFGVAVENAMPEVLSHADYICESATDNGVAKTIEKYCLNK